MQRYILGRVIQAIITVLFVSAVVFGLARLTGNPLDVIMPEEATQEDYAVMAAKLGLDKPLPLQYWIFLREALRGNLGESLRFKRPALAVVIERLPATLQLGVIAFSMALALAIPIGVYTAKYRGTWLDDAMRGVAIVGQSLPHFWTGIILILIFAVWLDWVPTSGKGGPETFILPAITLGYFIVAGVMRLTRSATLDILGTEYVKLARAKGVHEQIVIWKHAFKNAALPTLTYAAVVFVRILTGSIVTETVFAWPGIGRLVVEAVYYRDFAVVQTVVLIMANMYIMGNLIVDILYAYLNPKIRYNR
jgi:ABC-type dipeptide/oligopeptide/nickel transport system permease component